MRGRFEALVGGRSHGSSFQNVFGRGGIAYYSGDFLSGWERGGSIIIRCYLRVWGLE